MKLQEIYDMWDEDAPIKHNLEEASHDVPRLHAKYLKVYGKEKYRLTMFENEQNNLLHLKMRWFDGKLSKEEIDEQGWDYAPFGGYNNKITKEKMESYFRADKDVQKMELKLTQQKVKLDALKEILNVLTWRHNYIKNILDSRKFEAGF